MEEIRYRKFKGWNGTVYQVAMSREEAESRRKLEMAIAVPLTTIVFFLACCFAAGIF